MRLPKVNVFSAILPWEYWNTWLIYLPLWPFWLYYSWKNRSVYFFQKTNPGISFGGMAMQSKWEIYDLLPPETFPLSRYLNVEEKENFDFSTLPEFPFVVKPNEGLKGLGVKFINSNAELEAYFKKNDLNVIIQEKISLPLELGIFYARFPSCEKGFITGITQKKYMQVQGDGVLTVRELAMKNERIRRQLRFLEKSDPDLLNLIPLMDETISLLSIGSHTRGAEFIDVTTRYQEAIFPYIDDIATKIPGFYYGRFDILCEIEGSPLRIKQAKIIELNGAMSEPIHMYDPKNSLLYAWKEIHRHWKIMSQIAFQNRQVPYRKHRFWNGLKRIFQNLRLEKDLKNKMG